MQRSLRSTIGRFGSISGVALTLFLGTYQGIQRYEFFLELQGFVVHLAVMSAVPAIIGFSVLATLSSLLLIHEVYQQPDEDERLQSGPTIAAIVPVYRDGGVLRASVESLLASRYDDLEVVIAAEPGDEPTLSVARDLATHPDVRVICNDRPGSKANAINTVVERVDAAYFCAFDADERVNPDFVPVAMYHLVAENRDIFQARRVPRANGSVELLAYCERLLFHASYKLVEPFGFTYCRTSSVAFSKDAFERVDGLDSLLTEDIDFAHTCFREYLDVYQARYITNEMEAPHTYTDLWCQRKRWRIGHIQVFLKALTGGFERKGIRGAASSARLTVSLAASVFMVTLVAKVAVLLFYGHYLFAMLPFIPVVITILPILYRDYQLGHVHTISPTILLAPLIYPGFGLVTIRSAFEYALSWEGEWYQVQKTGT